MDPKTQFLVISILGGLVILAGLILVIIGMVKQKKSLIAWGVLIALIPTLISLFS